jgi:hypothetical protein
LATLVAVKLLKAAVPATALIKVVPPIVLFGQALAGEANGINSTFPGMAQAVTTANSIAEQLGGGMDVRLKRHIAVRALEADWLRTELPNSTTSAQNNLKLGAGVVLRFK